MSHEIDRTYYLQCAQKERERAASAGDIAIRRTHERLAEIYEHKVAKMSAYLQQNAARNS